VTGNKIFWELNKASSEVATRYPLGLARKPARPSRTCKHEEEADTCGIGFIGEPH